jgi:N-carbamoyl-L-amino-acid hydrolase
MITIGRVTVQPGSFSVVPGQVDFSLDFRSASQETLEVLEKGLLALAEDIASTRGLSFFTRAVDKTEPVYIPPRITGILREECQKLGYPFMMVTSGAGHDAQIVSSIAECGMIFIPCLDGISHSPEEMIDWEDLEKGANLLLRALIRLAS